MRRRTVAVCLVMFAILLLPVLASIPLTYAHGGCGDCMVKITCSPTTGAFCVRAADSSTGDSWSGTEVTGASAYADSYITFVSPGNNIPSGTVTYYLYTDSNCGGGGTITAGTGTTGTFTASSTDEVTSLNGYTWPETVTLNANGIVPYSQDTGPLGAGSYSFQAFYSGGDGFYYRLDCAAFTVLPMNTIVFDSSTSAAWSGIEVTGASAYDTASVTEPGYTSPAAGTVTYSFWTNNACSGQGTSAGTVTLTPTGAVPNSDTEGLLAAGSYSFQAVFTGSTGITYTSACEPFTVLPIDTIVFDSSTSASWSGTEVTGASAYDTVNVTEPGYTPAADGTVTYSLYTDGTCGASPGTSADEVMGSLNGYTWPQTMVTLSGGTVPNSQSQSTGPLLPGSYSFQAVFNGPTTPATDPYYGVTYTSSCEPFTVLPISTTVFDLSTNAAWSGIEVTGASAYDTASVTEPGYTSPAAGTVTYSFYAGTINNCLGSGTPAGTVTLSTAGAVPNSDTEGPLAAGSYSFQAVFTGSTGITYKSACESFSIEQRATPTITTNVIDASTYAAWSGTETTGASAYDTATVTVPTGAPADTGTISFTYWTNGACSGAGASAGAGSASSTEGPLGAGTYSFEATLAFDPNYNSATSACESFTVGPATPSISTTVDDAATPGFAWSGTEVTGASAYDTATVSGNDLGGIADTGTVSYTYFGTSACVSGGTSAGTGSASTTEGPLGAGTYYFQATVAADSNYNSVTGSCESFTVGPASLVLTTTVYSSGTAVTAPLPLGSTVYDEATVVTGVVSGFTPSGTLTITLYTTGTCTGTPKSSQSMVALGSPSFTTSPLAPGLYSFEASAYTGDSNYVVMSGNYGGCEPFSVQTPTTTLVACLPLTGTVGVAESCAAVVANNDLLYNVQATGTVSFTGGPVGMPGSCTLPGGTGVLATCTVTWTPGSGTEGTYTVTASYGSDPTHSPSTSNHWPLNIQTKTLTSVSCSPSTATVGVSEKCTATVTNGDSPYTTAASGTVTFTASPSGSGIPASCTLSGSSCSVIWTPASKSEGSYSITATYKGDTTHAGSTSSPTTLNIQTTTTTTVTCNPATGKIGTKETCTVTVTNGDSGYTSKATGTVTFSGTLPPGMATSCALSSGSCTVTWTPTSNGSYSITATYKGDTTHAASVSTKTSLAT